MVDNSRRRINWGEALIPGLALAFGLAYFLQTAGAPTVALYWPLMTAAVVAPLWVMIVFLFVLAKSAKPKSAGLRISWFWGQGGRVSLIFLGAVGYLVVIRFLGFSVTNFCFQLFIFRGLGSRRWVQNLAVAAGMSAFLHLALIGLMKMPLPRLSLGPLVF